MRGQKKVIKRHSPTGHTSDSSTSLHRGMKVYTLPPEMSGVSPEEGLSSSKLAQITGNARMLFSASKGSCLALSPGAPQDNSSR